MADDPREHEDEDHHNDGYYTKRCDHIDLLSARKNYFSEEPDLRAFSIFSSDVSRFAPS